MKCVYCGNMAETREHAPSRVFLKGPYPSDLPTVPSCVKCNNGFSNDELYVAVLLDLLKRHYLHDSIMDKKALKRLEKKEGKKAQEAFETHLSQPAYVFNDIRIKRVLQKLAICHATHELSEGYFGSSWESDLRKITYNLLPYMTQDEYDDIDAIEPLTLFPELGSIGYSRIMIAETFLSFDGGAPQRISIPFTTWHDVQDGSYRYLAFLDDSKIIVKIIIGEFLFTEIHFDMK